MFGAWVVVGQLRVEGLKLRPNSCCLTWLFSLKHRGLGVLR